MANANVVEERTEIAPEPAPMTPAAAIAGRVAALRTKLEAEKVDGMLIMRPENRAYISGFTGSSAFILVGAAEPVLITDFRYTEQAAGQCPGYKIVRHGHPPVNTIREQILAAGYKRLAFEKDYLTFSWHETLREKMPEVELVPTEGLVEGLRSVKDASEIALIRHAAEIADAAFLKVLATAKVGMREADFAVELEYQMRKAGAEKNAFNIIAASGPRSSLPHGAASDRVIQDGDFLTVDWGAMYQGYCSDCTRTVVFGRADARQREIYGIVLEAQLATVDAVRAGLKGMEVDAVARNIIAGRGYGDNFGHGLGHGVGRAVHELPSMGSRSENVLVPGNVVTVEPGIYIPEWGGVRIEDLVVVTESGREILTSISKELMEL